MNVKEILKKKESKVITITADQTLLQASELLAEHNIGAVVVVNSDENPIGILSERDIVRNLFKHRADVLERTVGDAMTSDVIIGFLDDDLSYVSSTMTEKRIRHLPIMDDKKLVGMVSIGDVVKTQLEHVSNEAHMLQQYISGA